MIIKTYKRFSSKSINDRIDKVLTTSTGKQLKWMILQNTTSPRPSTRNKPTVTYTINICCPSGTDVGISQIEEMTTVIPVKDVMITFDVPKWSMDYSMADDECPFPSSILADKLISAVRNVLYENGIDYETIGVSNWVEDEDKLSIDIQFPQN